MNFSLVRTVTADTEYLYFHLFLSEACSHEGKGVLKRLNDEVRCAMHGERNTVFNPAMGECSYLRTVSQWNMNFEVTT